MFDEKRHSGVNNLSPEFLFLIQFLISLCAKNKHVIISVDRLTYAFIIPQIPAGDERD